jgi:hypothetical protein
MFHIVRFPTTTTEIYIIFLSAWNCLQRIDSQDSCKLSAYEWEKGHGELICNYYLSQAYLYLHKKNIIYVIPAAIMFVALYNADFVPTNLCLCFTCILVVGLVG